MFDGLNAGPKKNIDLFKRKMSDLGLVPSPEELKEITKRAINAEPRLKSADILLQEAVLRTYLQDKIISSFLLFFTYVYGSSEVYDFQRKIIRYIETGELPEEWKDIPNSFFRHSGQGWEGNLCILIPRSLRKTTLAMALSVWIYLKDMSKRQAITHNDFTLSKLNLSTVQNITQLPDLVALFPDRLKESKLEYVHAGGRVTQSYLLLIDKTIYPELFTFAKEGSMVATSLNQDLTSQHYHNVIIDDIVVYETSNTPEKTAEVRAYIDRLNPLAVNLNKGITKYFFGTAWCEDSYYEILKKTDAPITFIQIPAAWGAIDEANHLYEHYLCPELLNEKGLLNQYQNIEDKRTFWSQFFMIPIPLGGNLIPMAKDDLFIQPAEAMPNPEECFNILSIDPISREKDPKRPNKSKGIALLFSIQDGTAYIRIPFTFNAVPDISDLCDSLVKIVLQYHVDAIIPEKVHAQRWLGQLLRKKLQEHSVNVPILPHQHKVSKNEHIFIESGLQAVFDSYMIKISSNEHSLIDQVKGKIQPGDEIDALSFVPSEIDNWEILKPRNRKKKDIQKLIDSNEPIFKGTPY